ncbi:uncharacterized protein RCO7_02039 [Rhynchosporium graminicola]|uniref:Uncharacterized protein n=1 Tax=Rhynchosporium graminicola TaxID=2792576 RepID=A0A1E1KTI5_9HELO|nr:uncharacterized protein RCO7_02039 [Rhynchosporium commune]
MPTLPRFHLASSSAASAAIRPIQSIQPTPRGSTTTQSVSSGDDGTHSDHMFKVRRSEALDEEGPAGAQRSVGALYPTRSIAGLSMSGASSQWCNQRTREDFSKTAAWKDNAVRRPIKLKTQPRPESHSPATALSEYLQLQDVVAKQTYWRDAEKRLPLNSLPTIILHQLYMNTIPKDDWKDGDLAYRNNAIKCLERRGLQIGDVERWAWILSGDSPGENVNRLVSITPDHPTVLLLEILRKDLLDVAELKKLLLHAWNHLEWRCSQNLQSLARTAKPDQMADHEFTHLIRQLLYQVRKIWPAATLSVAHMVPRYIQHLDVRSSQSTSKYNARIYDHRCKMINVFLPLLALPSSIEPYKSMIYNWSAQKVLLNLAGEQDPPLMLGKDSYTAVIQVLTASRKSDRESRASFHRQRTWPPWRTEQDGMDAQRAPGDDLSRASLAAIQSKEAGFRETSHDRHLRIYAGQELDGTPTIHTRKLVKRQPRSSTDGSELSIETAAQFKAGPNPLLWAARVEATRDIREAWRAFVAYKESGGKPNQALYLSIFQKLRFEQVSQGRNSAYEAAPGDGKEVLPVPDDNMSDFYKSHSKPPKLSVLYKQMLSSGIRPSGKCLIFLVRHARNSTIGVNYLRDSGLHPLALQYITGGSDTRISPTRHKPPQDILDTVGSRVLNAFIHLICRFAPRAVLTTSDEFNRYKLKPTPLKESLLPSQWAIQEFEETPYYRLRDPLRQAARLLKDGKVKFRPSWYCLFGGLARRNVVLRPSLIGTPENDALAWRFTTSVLRNFHECGLALDPQGFLLICTTFFKFAEATYGVSEKYEEGLATGVQLLKHEFAKLSASEVLPYYIPTLLHSVRWVVLHMYVRCMGIIGDCPEIITVLEWMVQHVEELEECNGQDQNSEKMLMRTLVAIKISCHETEYEERAMELVQQVPSWKWPDDGDLESYTGGSENAASEATEPSEDLNNE